MKIVLQIQHTFFSQIKIINTEEKAKRYNTEHKQNKYHDKAGLIHFKPQNRSTTSPTNTNMESAKIITTRIKSKKIVEQVLGNNIKFDQKFALSRGRISDDRLKEHMEIINGKQEDNYFVMSQM